MSDTPPKPSTVSLKDFAPEERSQILAIALKKGWTRDQITAFLEKITAVHASYQGKYSIIDILSRTKELSE